MNSLRQTIIEARNKIYDKQNKYENTIKMDKKEQIELLNQIETKDKNISMLNNDIINLKEELAKKKFEIDDLNEFGKEHLLDTLMSGNAVQIEVKEYKDKLLPTLVAWCKEDD